MQTLRVHHKQQQTMLDVIKYLNATLQIKIFCSFFKFVLAGLKLGNKIIETGNFVVYLQSLKIMRSFSGSGLTVLSLCSS